MSKTKEKVYEIIAEIMEISWDSITDESSIRDYEEWDSLVQVQIIASIIENFDIQVKLDDVIFYERISDFIDLAEGKK